MRFTFNKNNWSGEEATINVNQQTKSWTQNGYRFSLHLIDDEEIPGLGRYTKYEIRGEGWDFALGTVSRQVGLEETFEACDGACSRRHESPFVAASQLLFNII